MARTLLDLGAVLPLRSVHVALDDAVRRRLTDWDALLDTLVRHARRGRAGAGSLRAILDEHYGERPTGSAFERLVVALLCGAGLPRPENQHEVRSEGRHAFLDLAYPAERVSIELDGGVHLRWDVWESDRPRQNAVVLAGWTVLRFTWREYKERPERLVTQVRRALAAA